MGVVADQSSPGEHPTVHLPVLAHGKQYALLLAVHGLRKRLLHCIRRASSGLCEPIDQCGFPIELAPFELAELDLGLVFPFETDRDLLGALCRVIEEPLVNMADLFHVEGAERQSPRLDQSSASFHFEPCDRQGR